MAGCIAATALLAACERSRDLSAPLICARVKPVLTVDGQTFKDLNANRAVDPYEDRRLPVEQRIEDLVGRMTGEEKAGMMLIQTLNSAVGKFSPQGKLPFALASNAAAIVAQAPDAPGYPPADTLFPFGFGLTY